MRFLVSSTALVIAFWMGCCASDKQENIVLTEEAEMMLTTTEAVVTKVDFSGDENSYTFNVTIASQDTGCEQYADWWEVVDMDENLIYRRILTHSHVNEQPFTRSGGAVQISEITEVYVRAHMNNSGYGSTVQKGSVAGGFTSAQLDIDYAKDLRDQAPLPDGCAF